jgi:hypothetical protein
MSFWELPAGKLVKTIKLDVKKDISFPPFVKYSQDGKSVLTVTGKTLIRINLDSWQEEKLLADLNTEGVAYSPAKNVLVECRYSAKSPTTTEVRVFDLNSKDMPKSRPGPAGIDPNHPMIDLSADDGATYAIGVGVNTGEVNLEAAVNVYDTATGQSKGTVSFSMNPGKAIRGVRISPDGQRVVAWAWGSGPAFILLADSAGKNAKQIGKSADRFSEVTNFTGDGKKLAYTLAKGIRIYEVETGLEREP